MSDNLHVVMTMSGDFNEQNVDYYPAFSDKRIIKRLVSWVF